MNNSKIARVDKEWESKMREIMSDRLTKKLSIPTSAKDFGLAESTRLVLKCPSWPSVERELRSLPKKK
jgi:hypothetical protein